MRVPLGGGRHRLEDGRTEIAVNEVGLSSVTRRATLPRYLRELHERRHFIRYDARVRAFQGHSKLALGPLWLIGAPLLDIAMYGLIFGLVLSTSRGIENFMGFLTLGVVFFRFMQSGVVGGSGLIQGQQSMIKAFTFPRAALVLARVKRDSLDHLFPAAVAVVASLLFQWRTPLSWTVILVIPLYILIHVFALGLMFFVARLTVVIPDLKMVVNPLIRGWFYASGVFFALDRFLTHPTALSIMQANPGYRFLDAVRNVVLYATVPTLNEWLILLAWSVVFALCGLVFFWRGEESYVNTAS